MSNKSNIICKNTFKNKDIQKRKETFKKRWIDLINRLEKYK